MSVANSFDGEMDTRANATQKTHNSARKFFNKFIGAYYNEGRRPSEEHYKYLDDMNVHDVCGTVLDKGSLDTPNDPPVRKILSQFANYSLAVVKKDNGDNYQPDVIVQYFNSTKYFRASQYPVDPEQKEEWLARLDSIVPSLGERHFTDLCRRWRWLTVNNKQV